ncbi:hypothetical protein ACFFNX_51530, partial [Actinoallomurus acaciae]
GRDGAEGDLGAALDDDEDFYGDPVVFDTSLEEPTQPIPALDPALTEASPSPAPFTTFGALGATTFVTVDAEGRIRPADPASRRTGLLLPGTPPRRMEEGVPVGQAASPSAGPGPGESPPVRSMPTGSVPGDFRTTAATAVPRTRSARPPAPVREEAASDARPGTRPEPAVSGSDPGAREP